MGDREIRALVEGNPEREDYGDTPRGNEPVYVPGCFEEEEDEETVEDKSSFLVLRLIFSLFFPDRQVLLWFIVNAAIILVYALFNLNAATIGMDVKSDTTEDTTNTLFSMGFVLICNIIMYLAVMIFRFILVKGFLQFLCSRKVHFFVLFSMLDPHIFYVLWASCQSLLWQILINRPKGKPELFCIETFWPWITAEHMTFSGESLVWISFTIFMHIILALRCMVLSIISFIFELNLLVNSNEALKKYLKLYTSIRKFNIDWLSFVMSKQELMLKLKRAFANSRLRAKMFPIMERTAASVLDFRSKHGLKVLHEAHDARHLQCLSAIEGIRAPSDVTDALIEQTSTSAFSNWLYIYYVIRAPPMISLIHQEVVLKEDVVISDVAALLFEHMFVTVSKVKSKPSEQSIVNVPLVDSKLSFIQYNPLDNEFLESNSRVFSSVDGQEPEKDTATTSIEYNLATEGEGKRKSKHKSSRIAMYAAGLGRGKFKSMNRRAVSIMKIHEFRKTIVDMHSGPETSAVDNINLVTPDYQFNQKKGDDVRYLSTEQLQTFLAAEECASIMSLLDLSGHGRINLSMLQQALTNLYSTRKKFKSNIKGQDSVFMVLSRLLSAGSWLVAIVTMAFLAGITPEAIVVSGAALLSAITVALSYLYTNFLTSVIFVAFSNPYNVGDRIRLNDGETLTVKKIRTYTTEFVTILGKVLVYQNAALATMKITNESRSARATVAINFKVDASTTEHMLNAIHNKIATTCNSLPNDYVKDSVWMFIQEFNPGYCYSICIWVTCIESWGKWERIFQLKGEIMEVIMRECKKMGIGYSLPVQPISFTKKLSLSNVKRKELPPLGKRP